ncbi:MAG TPA: twin-arginine translocase TatA/TatE family subunit [Stenomitos sp.]
MFNLGWLEVSLIVLAAVLIFGPKQLPSLGGAIAKAMRGFKEELDNNNTDKSQHNHTEQ